MKNKNFYEKQDDLTAAKIAVYENYIGNYLFKILMGFGKCFIADLFCGTGSNGNKPGSPLILIDKIKYALTSDLLKNKNPEAFVLFNDENESYVEKLIKKLKDIEIPENIKLIYPESKKFKDILNEIKESLKSHGKDLPKFFFLDPFSYSVVEMQDIRDLMELNNAEVLLFLPVFHSYRFSNNPEFKSDHKTKIFLDKFTTKGIYDYKDIIDFTASIREKIKKDLDIKYVRSIILDAGKRKNALFLITRNQTGMLLFNKIIFKKAEDGVCINIGKEGCKTLFGTEGTKLFDEFANKLVKKLNEKRILSNYEIIDYSITEGFLPKHAKLIMQKLKDDGLLSIINEKNKKTNQLYIAEKPKNLVFFHYLK